MTQFHNHDSRDGLYVDVAFTSSAAANLRRDLKFDGTIAGNVYAQPLYVEGGPGSTAKIIAATESNNVYGLDAADGTIIWQRNVGEPVSADDLVCTKLDPMGITGTPIVDLASRALFLDAMITPDGGDDQETSDSFSERGHGRRQPRLARGRRGDSYIQRGRLSLHRSNSNDRRSVS